MTSQRKPPNGGNSSKNSNGLQFTPPPLTKGQIIANGQEAAQLLGSPVLNLAFESAIKNLQDEWLSTNPEESKRRDYLYNKAQALGHVAIELSGLVSEATALDAEQINREQAAQQNADADSGFLQ